ncbi:hypothetical protein [Nocardioides sp.]|uniref:hypothetical protein n=1 Tax=Nocardioides sp. TaxID=35761 RepID=UPI003782D56F
MTGRVVAAAYVATVAGLTAAAFSSRGDLWWAEVAAGVLTLPLVLVALPAIYLLGALAWSVADSPATGSLSSTDPVVADPSIWPVTLTFTVLMTLVACANVALVGWTLRRVARRRSRLASGSPW